mmetsp:Transcript_14842/g.34467  ORF Transcript_14842/g.34467 Transcript_14842/m.34467 type:complete len:86 (+) Transcript_14842:487-744(+)
MRPLQLQVWGFIQHNEAFLPPSTWSLQSIRVQSSGKHDFHPSLASITSEVADDTSPVDVEGIENCCLSLLVDNHIFDNSKIHRYD